MSDVFELKELKELVIGLQSTMKKMDDRLEKMEDRLEEMGVAMRVMSAKQANAKGLHDALEKVPTANGEDPEPYPKIFRNSKAKQVLF